MQATTSRRAGVRAAFCVCRWPSSTTTMLSCWALAAGCGSRRRCIWVAEVVPRLAGYARGTTRGSFGIEKRGDGIAMTLAHVARGAGDSDSWFIGFNIHRKFF